MPKPQYFETAKRQERAVLLGVETPQQKDKTNEYLLELASLVFTSGAEVVGSFIQKLQYPDPKTYFGKGRLDEVAQFLQENEVDLVVFDDELSPSQVRNIESVFTNVKVLSRTHLILDIFAANAKTAQARTQVELAQSEFMLPRLTGLWTHLSKQKGGIGMKGPGETEIETDRRILRDKIHLLKEKLREIERQNKTQRQGRKGVVRVALVGYTNVGKSTIMNLLSRADILAENKLFATLDSTVRKISLPKEDGTFKPILLSDTVGFIRKLPTQLVQSFKSTLAEVVEADVLLHVVDVSNESFEEQMLVVKNTLHEIGASNKKEIIVFNKIDSFEDKEETFLIGNTGMTLQEFEKSWLAKENTPCVFISATEKTNITKLKDIVISQID